MCPKKTASWLALAHGGTVATEGNHRAKILKELEKQTGHFLRIASTIHIEPQKKKTCFCRA